MRKHNLSKQEKKEARKSKDNRRKARELKRQWSSEMSAA